LRTNLIKVRSNASRSSRNTPRRSKTSTRVTYIRRSTSPPPLPRCNRRERGTGGRLHRTHCRRRYHPPPPRHHRNRIRRPDHRAAGAPALRRFGANSAWILCAAIAHNLLRATATLAGGQHAAARGATLRRDLINVPARLARPQRRPVLHLPSHWTWAHAWLRLWRNTIGRPHPQPA